MKLISSVLILLITIVQAVSFAADAPKTPAEAPSGPVEVKLEINDDKVLHQVADNFHGINLCALWNDTYDSPGTLKAFAQMGMKTVRFPGGVPCQWYDWKDPLGTGWTVLTPERAYAFAKAGGAEMIFQTNSANDSTNKNKTTGKDYKFCSSGEHAAEWVKWAKEKEMKVAFWEIGNEPEMDAPKDFKATQEKIYEWYNAKYKEQVEAIRKVDPNVRVMGPAATNTWFWWAQRNIEKFLKAHGNKTGSGLADALSIHWYTEGGGAPWEKSRSYAQGWQGCMDYINKAIKENDDRKLPLYITEWNFGGGDKTTFNSFLGNALGCADCIGMFLRTGVAGHTFFVLQKIEKGWGVLALGKDSRPQNEANPTYYALCMASKLGHSVLELKNSADEKNVLSAYATKDAAGGIQVMMINKSDKPANVALSFAGYKPDGREIQVYTLEGANGSIKDKDVSYNGVKTPKPHEQDLPPPATVKGGSAVSQAVPAYSMAVLCFAAPSGAKKASANGTRDGAQTAAAKNATPARK